MKPISSLSSNSISGAVIEGVSPDPTGLSRNSHAALEQALTRGDLTEFRTISAQYPEACGNAVFDNGQNMLHLAIASQNYEIAHDIVDRYPEWKADLVNVRDDHGQTPLMYVCQGTEDDDNLVGKLMSVGVSEDLIGPVTAAARKGHENIIDELQIAGADLTWALLGLCDASIPAEEIERGMNCLLAGGAIIQDAMSDVALAGNHLLTAALQLRGASGSDAILTYASHGMLDEKLLTTLLRAGSDLPTAFIELVRQGDLAQAQQLQTVGRRVMTDDAHPRAALHFAVVRLLESGDTASLRKIQPLLLGQKFAVIDWKDMVHRFDASALKELLSLGLEVPKDDLKTLLILSQVGSIKKLLQAGVPASDFIKAAGHKLTPDELIMLKAAGVDLSEHGLSIPSDRFARKEQFQALRGDDQLQVIAQCVSRNAIGLIAYLLTAAKDPQDMLRQAASRPDGANMCYHLLHSDLVEPGSLLVEFVKSDQVDAAKALLSGMLRASMRLGDSGCAPLLFQLLRDGDHELVKKFIPAVITGAAALAEAASRNAMDVVEGLIAQGADVSGAIGVLMAAKQAEAAGRIMSLDVAVDLKRAGMWMFDSHITNDFAEVLRLNGIDLTDVMLLAAKEEHSGITYRMNRDHPSILVEALSRVATDPDLSVRGKKDMVRALSNNRKSIDHALLALAHDPTKTAALAQLLTLGIGSDRARQQALALAAQRFEASRS
ncbi:hypothetical protein [Bordetella sp. 15P40C-2]|uniref:hypothetical protein n=1 Tax=Bordetella sp. 15P40C-2 TaxID=2572246 RepID=UPI00132396AD|nr:hypothetical protein [Bordetella sp. 15P40C-2]MVW70864.1 hypothetical protein [Bordetella sp. 15P40C-2]